MESDPTEEHPVNLDQLKQNIGDDKSLLQELIDIFIHTGPDMITAIKAALTAQDAKALTRAAHALKGTAGNFGAETVVRLAAKLESLGDDAQLAGTQQLLEDLERELNVVLQELRKLKDNPPL